MACLMRNGRRAISVSDSNAPGPYQDRGASARAAGEPITAEGLAALRAQIEELEGPRRRELAERIKTARELGDLSENADYHIAKDDQAHLETRIQRLRERLTGAVVVENGSDGELCLPSDAR